VQHGSGTVEGVDAGVAEPAGLGHPEGCRVEPALDPPRAGRQVAVGPGERW